MTTSMMVDGPAVELLLRFARAAHESGGYPANELEPRISDLAQTLGLDAVQVSVTPTDVNVTVGSIPDQQAYMLRVQPRPVDLYAMGRLDEIAAGLADGRLDHGHALAKVDELAESPLRRPTWLLLAAKGLIGAALAPILGGGWRESLAAAMTGLVVGIVVQIVERSERSAALAAPLAAFVASFFASVLAHAGFHIAVRDVTFAGLVALLPGMTMTVGIGELATGHLQSGLANVANAMVQLVGLVFGVAVGASVATSSLGPTPVSTPIPFPGGVEIAGAALVGLAFVVTLRAPARDAVWMCSAAVLATVANLVATNVLRDEVEAVFAAALVVGLAGHAVAHRYHRSALSFIVPGLLMLVPGGIGFESASSLLAGRTIRGIDEAFDTFVIMLAISYGLLVSTLVLPDRPATHHHAVR
ncbi:MAG TPA: threonine/serine exporter family protein [Vicinamibacterales bacterium]